MSAPNTLEPFDAEVLAERLRDVAASHYETALGFGISRDNFERCATDAARVARDMARAPVATDWRPMDTAPFDGREVLLQVERRAGSPWRCLVGHFMPGGHCIEDHPPIARGWYFWNGREFDIASKPTGWLPLPPDEIYAPPVASAPVAGEAVTYLGANVAERLESMADDQPPGSQAQSDLYAAATIWRKHIDHHAAPQASEVAHKEAAAIARSFGAPDMANALDPAMDAPQASEAVRVTDTSDALADAQTALASALHLLTKYAPGHHWLPRLGEALEKVKARAALSAQPGPQKGCNCATCRPHSVEMRMILCEVCGDKRCPHAADHRNDCAGTAAQKKEHSDA